MFFHSSVPQISVCIPVYRTEKYLAGCLKSFAGQKIPDGFRAKDFFEIVVVDDASCGGADRIVKSFGKTVRFSVRYVCHSENKSVFEARRTAVYEAKGKFIVFVDSDDLMAVDGLFWLYQRIKETGADIVHGHTEIKLFEDEVTLIDSMPEKVKALIELRDKRANLIAGSLKDRQIFRGFLVDSIHSGFLWGKIYSRELCLKALAHVPPVFSNYANDFLLYFWLCFEAKLYEPLDTVVYKYFVNSGITSNKQIDDLKNWERVCSTSSVFTAIYSALEEEVIELQKDEEIELSKIMDFYVKNNLETFRNAVVEELKPVAYKMLCDSWGEELIDSVR